MTADIRIGADAHSNHLLSLMRDSVSHGEMKDHLRFMPGLLLAADPALGISGTFGSPQGRILDLDVKISGEGHWLGLHISFPQRDISQCGVIGLACRTSCNETEIVRACVRSGTDNGFVDCFFDKHILLQPEERSHLDALDVHRRDLLPLIAPWREIILFLPVRSCRLSLVDLRLFAV
jgi:hypothetical protein